MSDNNVLNSVDSFTVSINEGGWRGVAVDRNTSSLDVSLSNTDNFSVSLGTGGGGGVSNYNELIGKPQINGVTLVGNKTGDDLGLNLIHTDTTENWNAQRDLVAQSGHIYIYSDYRIIDGVPIPAMKVGDGTSYLIDMPFMDGSSADLDAHIHDTTVHITEAERVFWNNKVTAFLSQGSAETLVLTKN